MKIGVKNAVATIKGVSLAFLQQVKGYTLADIEAKQAFGQVVFADEGDLLDAVRPNGKTLRETLGNLAAKYPHLAATVARIEIDGLFSSIFTAAAQGEEARKVAGIFVTQDDVEKAIKAGTFTKPTGGKKEAAKQADQIELEDA